MVLPAASGRHAMSQAYLIAAPADGPTIMPSVCATLVAHSTHSAVEAWPHSSTTPRGESLSSAAGLPGVINSSVAGIARGPPRR
eukprot:scaffold70838_cov82-Phaeocystis_antarctica.AAC.1